MAIQKWEFRGPVGTPSFVRLSNKNWLVFTPTTQRQEAVLRTLSSVIITHKPKIPDRFWTSVSEAHERGVRRGNALNLNKFAKAHRIGQREAYAMLRHGRPAIKIVTSGLRGRERTKALEALPSALEKVVQRLKTHRCRA